MGGVLESLGFVFGCLSPLEQGFLLVTSPSEISTAEDQRRATVVPLSGRPGEATEARNG